MFRKIFILLIFALHIFSTTTYAIKVAPRITDREIVEKLSKLEAGQAALNQRIDDLDKKLNQRIDDLDKKLNQRIDDLDKRLSAGQKALNQRIDDLDKKLNQRIDDLFTLTLTLFGIMTLL